MVATPILLDFLVYICNNIRKLRFDLVVRVLRAFFFTKNIRAVVATRQTE